METNNPLLINLDFTPSRRLYQDIGLKLQQQITQGLYAIGDRLPPERDIAEALDVSRSVVREATIMLELQGLVEVRKGSGVYVTKLPEPASLSSPQSDKQLRDIGPFELLQARQVVESQIASFAATTITKNEISRLKQYLEQERVSLDNHQEDYNSDKLFHLTIAEASQNSVLSDIVADFWRIREDSEMWSQLHLRITSNDYRYQWLDDHEKILLALQRRDPECARKMMWQHIENVKTTLFELSDVDDPEFDGFLFR